MTTQTTEDRRCPRPNCKGTLFTYSDFYGGTERVCLACGRSTVPATVLDVAARAKLSANIRREPGHGGIKL